MNNSNHNYNNKNNKINKRYLAVVISSLCISVAISGCNSNSGDENDGGNSKANGLNSTGGSSVASSPTEQSWKYTYGANRLLETATDPNGNVTRYEEKFGTLTIRNPLNQRLYFDNFEKHGKPKRMIDINGKNIYFSYTPRGLLETFTGPDEAVTRFAYDKVGNLTKLIMADGTTFSYVYDDANYLMEIEAPYGTIKYTRDDAGNITSQNINGGTYSDSRTYDELNRLLKITTATSSQSFTYDNDDNLASSTDGRNNKTAMSWDDLQRISSVTDAKNGVSNYSYNNTQSIENPISISDAMGSNTNYKYNGLGMLLSLASPDSGSHHAAYDANGNLLEETDSFGRPIKYTYDALNRPISINYSSNQTQDTTFRYDYYTNSKGHLSNMDSGFFNNSYDYDARGNMTGNTQTIPLVASFNIGYAYDKADHMTHITYPSSNNVEYTYTHGQLDGVILNGKSIAKISHLPFGPINKIVYGNGVTEDLSYNTDYSLKQQTLSNGLLDHTYSYYPNGQIKDISNVGSYDYDKVNSLTTADNQTYTYDKNQNRTTQTTAGIKTDYGIQAGSNRLLTRTINAVNSDYQYDTAGNMISDNGKTYTYDGLNQLRSVKQGVDIIATYEYNALSQRVVKKTPDGGTTVFVYSSVTGQLLEEYNKQTKVKRDYIYAEGKLIAFIENNILVYVITDHLNAPQMLLDSTGRNIWSATYDAFGKATITGNLKLNLRADGQYNDDETGLYYNWYRYYNPSLGRYITSDPLGLQAGMNTYVYVNGNPINYTDPMGLRADGGSIGGSFEYMGPYLGGAINLSSSIGVYSGGAFDQQHGGLTVSFGGFVRIGKYVLQYPKPQDNGTSSLHEPNGMSISGGFNGGYFNSNANCIEQMNGYSDNYNINAPVLPISYQQSISGNIKTDTYSVSTKKGSIGVGGASSYPMQTKEWRLPTISIPLWPY